MTNNPQGHMAAIVNSNYHYFYNSHMTNNPQGHMAAIVKSNYYYFKDSHMIAIAT